MRVIKTVTAALLLLAVMAAPAAAGPGDKTIGAEASHTLPYTPGYGSGCDYDRIDPSSDYSGTADTVDYYAQIAAEEAAAQGISGDNNAIQTEDGTWVWEISGGDGIDYRYYSRNCSGVPGGVWVPTATTANLGEGAYQRLIRLLPEPDVELTPLDNTYGWAYTQVATDFRLEADDWRIISVTATAGPAWATARATPRLLRYTPGDPARPAPVECDDPMAVYTAANPGDCSYTYLNASSTASGNQFEYEVMVIWDIVFTGNAGPPPAPRVEDTSSTDTVEVAEARPSS